MYSYLKAWLLTHQVLISQEKHVQTKQLQMYNLLVLFKIRHLTIYDCLAKPRYIHPDSSLENSVDPDQMASEVLTKPSDLVLLFSVQLQNPL